MTTACDGKVSVVSNPFMKLTTHCSLRYPHHHVVLAWSTSRQLPWLGRLTSRLESLDDETCMGLVVTDNLNSRGLYVTRSPPAHGRRQRTVSPCWCRLVGTVVDPRALQQRHVGARAAPHSTFDLPASLRCAHLRLEQPKLRYDRELPMSLWHGVTFPRQGVSTDL